MLTADLDFHLPPELIAQEPAAQRAASRLLVYRRQTQAIEHRVFADLPRLLRRGDLLVFNDTRVLPARFYLRKETGGLVEALFICEQSAGRWRVMLKNAGEATKLTFENEKIGARISMKHDAGEYDIELDTTEPATSLLSRLGRMPLPPYIKRDKLADPHDAQDVQRYQTVYARQPGAVAAPTAGLHFTQSIFDELEQAGVEHNFITLHVGIGTFKPVSTDTLEAHAMHAEAYEITDVAAEALNRAGRDRRRIVAVGTTSARVLESQPDEFTPRRSETSIFIYPPYRFRHVDALITNFHLPRSTLIALVAAMIGLDEQRRTYDIAIAQRYRFFSYGDAMLIE